MLKSWKLLAAAAAVIALLAAASLYLLDRVSDAKARAQTAEDRVEELAGRMVGFQSIIDDISRRQQETETMVSTRLEEDFNMQKQLSELRSDLNKVMTDDPETNAWADVHIPGALTDRLRGGAASSSGARTAKDNPGAPAGRAAR